MNNKSKKCGVAKGIFIKTAPMPLAEFQGKKSQSTYLALLFGI